MEKVSYTLFIVVLLFLTTGSQQITFIKTDVCKKNLYVEKQSDSFEESEHSKDVEKESIYQAGSTLNRRGAKNRFATIFEEDRTKIHSPPDKPPRVI